METYGNVSRDAPPPEPPRKAPHAARRSALQREKSVDRDDEEPPPVPEKHPELLREISQKVSQQKSNANQNIVLKPVPKKRKKVPTKLDEKPVTPDDSGTVSPIDNPFYDGIIVLNKPPSKTKTSPDASKDANVNGLPPVENTRHARDGAPKARSSAPGGYGVYELAGPDESLDENVAIDQPSDSGTEATIAQVRPKKPKKENRAPTNRTAKPKREADADSAAISSIIVDKYFYNFIWTFKTEEMASIQEQCKLKTNDVKGDSVRDIAVTFRPKKGNTHDIDEQVRKFKETYQRLQLMLVVENINVSQVKDVSELQNELENVFESLCFHVSGKQMDVVCEKKNKTKIKRCITKHGGLPLAGEPQLQTPDTSKKPKPKKSSPTTTAAPTTTIPISYNVNGRYRLHIYMADITQLHVDAIVNAANGFLRHGGGVARAIQKAAGPDLEKEGREIIKRREEIPVSQVVRTTAGRMPSKMVLHAVGPRWPSKKSDVEAQLECIDTLTQTFNNVLIAANKEVARSVAIPPISSGIFSVPKDKVAGAVHAALLKASDPKSYSENWTLQDVHIVDVMDTVLGELVTLISQSTNHETQSGEPITIEEIPHNPQPRLEVKRPNEAQTTGIPNVVLPVGFSIGSAYHVYIYNADITRLNVDAVVNSANVHLQHDSGVSKSIADAAGPALVRACQEVIKKRVQLHETEVVKTISGDMTCKMVLHAVGPVWPAGEQAEKEKCLKDLRKTFDNVLKIAFEQKVKSIAIPTISSGVSSVPVEKVACALYMSLIENADPDIYHPSTKHREIHVVDQSEATLVELAELFGDGGMVRVSSGKKIALTRLEQRDIRVASNDRHREMIVESPAGSVKKKKSPGNFFAKLCGGSHKER